MTSAPTIRRLDTNESLFHAFSKLGAFTTAQVLHVDGRISEDQLREALRRLAFHHPRVTSRIVESDDGPVWHRGAPAIPLHILPPERCRDPEQMAAEALSRRSPADPEALLQVAWAADGERHTLCFATHHSVADGISASRLAVELVALLNDVAEGRPLVVGEVAAPCLDQVLESIPVASGVAHRFHRLQRRLFGPRLQSLTFDAPAAPEQRATRVSFDTIPAPMVERLRRSARQYGATIGGVLTAALLVALKVAEAIEEPFEVSTQVSLRGRCSPTIAADAIGCYSGRVVTQHHAAEDFWQVARSCTNEVKRAVRRGEPEAALVSTRGRVDEIAAAVARHIADPVACGRTCVLAVSNRGVRSTPPEGRAVRLAKYFSAVANDAVGASIQLSCGSLHGDLHCSLIYVTPLVSEGRARTIWTKVRDVLESSSAV